MTYNCLKHKNIPDSLSCFLNQTDREYIEAASALPLFDIGKTAQWSAFQKTSFAAIFYHIRGHFINFMWYMANFSTDSGTKELILDNISEELGTENKFSHESLYQRFALECGVDINQEILDEQHYLDFVKKFNKGHIQWLSAHDSDDHIAAFSAYERLDNIDYPFLTELASSIGISSSGMTFFRVHMQAEHFSAALKQLVPVWESTPDKVKQAFHFINSHQLNMWKQLSETIFALEA